MALIEYHKDSFILTTPSHYQDWPNDIKNGQKFTVSGRYYPIAWWEWLMFWEYKKNKELSETLIVFEVI